MSRIVKTRGYVRWREGLTCDGRSASVALSREEGQAFGVRIREARQRDAKWADVRYDKTSNLWRFPIVMLALVTDILSADGTDDGTVVLLPLELLMAETADAETQTDELAEDGAVLPSAASEPSGRIESEIDSWPLVKRRRVERQR